MDRQPTARSPIEPGNAAHCARRQQTAQPVEPTNAVAEGKAPSVSEVFIVTKGGNVMWVKATAEHCWINLNHASYAREEDDARLHVHELPGFTEVPAIDEAFMDFERRIYDQIIPAAPGQF